jgi:diguanylate cyclase (GGDEF)-like protein
MAGMRRIDVRSPVLLFRLLMGLIAVVATISLVMVFYTAGEVDSASRQASERSDIAVLAAEASHKLRELLEILHDRPHQYLNTAEFLELPAETQDAVRAELSRVVEGPTNPLVYAVLIPLSLEEAANFQGGIDYLRSRLDMLLARSEDATLELTVASERQRVQEALGAYYAEPTVSNLRRLELRLGRVLELTSARVPGLAAESALLREDLHDTIGVLKKVAVALAIGGAACLVLFGRFMSLNIQRTLQAMRTEGSELAATTQRLQYRNQQLNALYNVFSEITSTLSLHYVVQATMRESMQIMNADMSVLRILRGGELVVEGAMISDGQDIAGLRPVPLGEGPTGQTAKRGRTMRIDKDGEQLMGATVLREPGNSPAEQTNRAPMQSGLIVPLVVGARVVGTLACWSHEESRFNDEDERILEMMASQVATAIVAADTTDTSVQRALHDALTGLPNRRQLDEDKDATLAELARRGHNAVVAMIDIDHFKRFNDDYGHRVGDVTLQKVASVLRSSVREGDRVYRYGGEEFLVVFTDTPRGEAWSAAERLRLAVESAPLSGENLEPVGPVTISIGLALIPDHGTDIETLIGRADKAMYRAKQGGRNRVEVWDESDVEGLDSVA